jgi:hypothetical protein
VLNVPAIESIAWSCCWIIIYRTIVSFMSFMKSRKSSTCCSCRAHSAWWSSSIGSWSVPENGERVFDLLGVAGATFYIHIVSTNHSQVATVSCSRCHLAGASRPRLAFSKQVRVRAQPPRLLRGTYAPRTSISVRT